jgi:hypothetical protein
VPCYKAKTYLEETKRERAKRIENARQVRVEHIKQKSSGMEFALDCFIEE